MKFPGLLNKDLNHTSSCMKEFNGAIHMNKSAFMQLLSSLMWAFDSRNNHFTATYLQTKLNTSTSLVLSFRTTYILLNPVV